MGGKRIPEEVKTMVQYRWFYDQKQSASKVKGFVNRAMRNEVVSLRTTQLIIAETKSRTRPFTPVEWQPWIKPVESPEETRYLLLFRSSWRAQLGRPFYKHEALWAHRLRACNDAIEQHVRDSAAKHGQASPCFLSNAHKLGLALVLLYGQREQIAKTLGEEIADTGDLDDLVAFEPWTVERWHDYEDAISKGWARRPNMILETPSSVLPNILSGTNAILMWFFTAITDTRTLDSLYTGIPASETGGGIINSGYLFPKGKEFCLRILFDPDAYGSWIGQQQKMGEMRYEAFDEKETTE